MLADWIEILSPVKRSGVSRGVNSKYFVVGKPAIRIVDKVLNRLSTNAVAAHRLAHCDHRQQVRFRAENYANQRIPQCANLVKCSVHQRACERLRAIFMMQPSECCLAPTGCHLGCERIEYQPRELVGFVTQEGAKFEFRLQWVLRGAIYTLNKKFITSPSCTTYSLPSARILPASFAPFSPLSET
jgi:hypothetical protein